MKQETTNFSLKDQLFNREKVGYIAGLIQNIYSDFEKKNFVEEVLEKFPELELTQRITHISEMFKKYLPEDFEESVNILVKSLPENEENGTLDNNFGDFIFAPFSEFVAIYGLEYIDNKPHPNPLLSGEGITQNRLDFCLEALEKMTVNFSAEFSIRYFLNSYEKETFKKMLEWSKSKNYHVRRLASEGSRQKLPWGKGISLDYKKTIQILDNLYTDESRFVTRSVANHLNDISKIDPKLVVDTLKKWKTHPQPLPSKEGSDIDYIISHSTRGLVKAGHKETLELLGYSSDPKIEVTNFGIKSNIVKIGEVLEFKFDIIFLPFPKGTLTSLGHSKVPEGGGIRKGEHSEKLIVDYKIYFQNKAGALKPKVFKIKKGKFSGITKIEKQHKLKLMTTKALYSGEHAVEIIINGKSFGKKSFELKK